MATSPFSEASYCKVLVPRPTHKRGRQGVAHDREPVERAAFRGSDGLEPPKSVTVRTQPLYRWPDPTNSLFQRSNRRLGLAVELRLFGEFRGGDGFDEDADLAVFLVAAVDQVVEGNAL